MANERKWLAVTQLFTANGTVSGVIKVLTSRRFKVKAKIILQSNTQAQKEFEIKAIPDCNTIEVGPCSKEMDDRSDLSMYLLADAAVITQPKQKRPAMGPGEIDRAVYEEEPTVARRVFPVDDCGKGYTVDHPFPVQLSDGSVNIGTVNAELEVQLSAKDDDPHPGDVHDSVRIGDGDEELAINPDGSINVVTTLAAPANPFIINTPIPLANIEYTAVLPQTARRFLFRLRNASKCQITFVVNQSNTNFVTMNAGTVYSEDGITLSAPLNLYFRSSKAGETAEILYWT